MAPSTLLALFNCLIKPVCTYGSEIWGADISLEKNLSHTDSVFNAKYIDKQPAEKLDISFCKSILGVSKKCCER